MAELLGAPQSTQSTTSDEILRFGSFEVDVSAGELRRGGVKIKLHGQPFDVLVALLEKPGQVLTRDELQERLWSQDTFVDFEHGLNKAVNKIREALGDDADNPRFIETLPRRGYRFLVPVTAPATEHVSKLDEASAEKIAPPPGYQSFSVPLTRLLRAGGMSILVLAFLAGAIYWATSSPHIPRIVGSHVLTHTGYPKAWGVRPIVGTDSLYFDEERPGGWVTLQVSTKGAELSPVANINATKANCCLIDISRDGSQALEVVCNPKHKGCDTWVQALPAGTPRLLVEDAGWPMWNAQGDGIFFTRNSDRELYRANLDGTGVEKVATFANRFNNPHLSPDGSRIRFSGDYPVSPLWEVRTDGSNAHPILSGYQNVGGGAWSPDRKYYFFTAWDGNRLSLWTISEARHWWKSANTLSPQQLTFGPMSMGSPGISKDGKQLYAVGIERHGELSAYDDRSGKFVPILGGESICMVDFSRDGEWIAYVAYPEGTLWRSRVDGSERLQLTAPPLAVVNPRWSPDGKFIVFTDVSNGDRRTMTYFGRQRVYEVSGNGGEPVLLLAGYFGDPTWSPDGRSIAYNYRQPYSGSEVRILNLQSQKSATVPGSQGMSIPSWSPDGKYLVALAEKPPLGQKLMLFSFASNSWVELASTSLMGNFGWPSWSRDSKFVNALEGGPWSSALVRIALASHNRKRIASLQGVRATSYYFDRVGEGWSGFTPDGRPLITRDTGIEELYAFDLEYK